MTPLYTFYEVQITDQLLDSIKNSTVSLLYNYTVAELHLYLKTSVLYEDTVEYLVVSTAFIVSNNTSVYNIVSDIPILLNKIYINVDVEANIVLFLEIQSYNMTGSEYYSTLEVPSGKDVSSDEFSLIYSYLNSPERANECSIVNKLFECTYIEIGFDEVRLKLENDILYVEEPFVRNITFSRWEYAIHEDRVHICLSDYRSIYDAISNRNIPSRLQRGDNIHPKEIVSFICVCFSIVSLLVTIVIYVSFSELQSQPGINNVILSISLLLAQALYQFGTGQRSLSQWACAVVGAISHFLWLSVIFAMNVCSIYMFTIFKKNVQLLPNFHWRQTVRNILYIVSASLFFVVISLIVSLVSTEGADSGYGGGVICYLSSYVTHLVTLILPLAIVLTVNISLFAYVVVKLTKANKSSNSTFNLQRNYFAVYARLSTLTGITWVVGFLQLVIESEVIEYLFIILNASQGVFIMVAFVLNKRIYSLFSRRKCVCYVDKTNTSFKTSKTDSQLGRAP